MKVANFKKLPEVGFLILPGSNYQISLYDIFKKKQAENFHKTRKSLNFGKT